MKRPKNRLWIRKYGFAETQPFTPLVSNYKLAFTLVELIIVVSILGILAAIVLPEVQGHTQRAKEAAAKDNLRILRTAIERYAINHNGIAPGYLDNNPTNTPGSLFVINQLIPDYISEIPENPFNGLQAIRVLSNNETLTEGMSSTSLIGWIYQPSTKIIKLNWIGTDSENVGFYDY